MIINDPREYPRNYPQSNQLIKLASKNANFEEIIDSIHQLLKKGEDTTINIALNLAPNYNAVDLIFQGLINAIEKECLKNSKFFFAIPILLVVGSKKVSTIKNNINIVKIQEFFKKNEIINNKFELTNIVLPETLMNFKPSLLFNLATIKDPLSNLNLETEINFTKISKEAVLLRYLIGMCETNINIQKYNESKVEFMKLILEDLKNPNVVLYPIPCNITSLLEAGSYGNTMRKDVALQIAISNVVKKLRKAKLTPKANVGTIVNAITIKISSLEISNLKEEVIWDLNKLDNFKNVLESILKLLQDMHVIIHYE